MSVVVMGETPVATTILENPLGEVADLGVETLPGTLLLRKPVLCMEVGDKSTCDSRRKSLKGRRRWSCDVEDCGMVMHYTCKCPNRHREDHGGSTDEEKDSPKKGVEWTSRSPEAMQAVKEAFTTPKVSKIELDPIPTPENVWDWFQDTVTKIADAFPAKQGDVWLQGGVLGEECRSLRGRR